MVAVVTGGSGFIGRHLVQQLLDQGQEVRVLDLKAPALPKAVTVIEGSVTDHDILSRAFRGAEVVYHLAGNPNLWTRNKADFYQINTLGTQRVLESAARLGVGRVVHTSSPTVLIGRRTGTRPSVVTETLRLRSEDMLGDYCRSKLLAEEAALEWAAKGLSVVVVIPTLPIGPGDDNLTPPSRMILDFLNGKVPAFLESHFNLVDVRDLAASHITAAKRGRSGERYILGGRNLRLSALLTELQEVTGLVMPQIQVPYALAHMVGHASEFLADFVTGQAPKAPLTGVRLARFPVAYDSGKAERDLGLSNRPLRQSLEDQIRWLCQQGLILESRALPLARRPALS